MTGLALVGSLTLLAAPPAAPSFEREVMAVLSRAGCNQGTCHGNRSGKGGLKLSLRGQDPTGDYIALTRDIAGRRVDTMDAARSLILRKPLGELPHEGGRRFAPGSAEHVLVRDWIAAGCPRDAGDLPRLERLSVSPAAVTIQEPASEAQLVTLAVFADGSSRDVTALAAYEAVGDAATVTPDGLVLRRRFGAATVLVRYLALQMPVRVACVPDRPEPAIPEEEGSVIDRLHAAGLRRLRLEPSPLAADHELLRRAHLDLLGNLPSPEEARAYLADDRPDRWKLLVERLLERPELDDFWALKWSDLLRNEEKTIDAKGVQAFHNWIRSALARRVPLDELARQLIAARGSTYKSPAANYYRALRDPFARAETTAQLFLGTRLACARCHNHPFDRWTQDDYYSWAGLFARVDYKVLENRRRDTNDSHEFVGEQVVWLKPAGEVTNARTGRPATPRLLGAGGEDLSAAADPLQLVAGWVTSRDNPLFARALANRIWYHLLGRGIVDPIDDFRATNPPSNPELLDELAAELVRSGFDLRHLLRLIVRSRAYRLSSRTNATNEGDETAFSHGSIRRLTAEQLLDAQARALDAPVRFAGYPAGTRAVQLAGVRSPRARGRSPDAAEKLLGAFGKPPRQLACDCERSATTTLTQAFQLLSGPLLNELLERPDNRLGQLIRRGASSSEAVTELYWAALSRPPSGEELIAGVALVESVATRRHGLEDLAWSLLNAKEFLLRP